MMRAREFMSCGGGCARRSTSKRSGGADGAPPGQWGAGCDHRGHLVGIVLESDMLSKFVTARKARACLGSLSTSQRWVGARQKLHAYMASELMTTRVIPAGPDARTAPPDDRSRWSIAADRGRRADEWHLACHISNRSPVLRGSLDIFFWYPVNSSG